MRLVKRKSALLTTAVMVLMCRNDGID